jgi:NarL family two-component system response regulator LiaR
MLRYKMEKIRVLIVDDDIEWSSLIKRKLSFEDDLEVVGTAVNEQDALLLSRSLIPDIVLMDINLSGRVGENRGLFAAATIINELNIRTIILSSITDQEVYKHSFLIGALQYVEKGNTEGLAGAIRNSMRSDGPMQALVNELRRLKREEYLSHLSLEERKVFELFEGGYSSKEVENKLFKPRNTLRNQIKSINKKMNAKSIREAITKVRKNEF